jgi:formate--tetrahydrofolate ligase
MHGGIGKDALNAENVDAVKNGCTNLARHIENMKYFGVPVVVAINRFSNDTDEELAAVREVADSMGVKAIVANHWEDGSAGTEDLARHVVELVDGETAEFQCLYPDKMPLLEKIETIATKIYRASGITADASVLKQIETFQEDFGNLPICFAKTQYSFSTNPESKGAPVGYKIPIKEVRLSAGAGFIVVVAGAIMTMPGLPRKPAANSIHINQSGVIEGLF